ncbi:MAG: 2,3,4,5-tetrahydropyridine-2,6-dicarboxylate N-succinyltransferase [Actinobacteria bacterium]|nr:2,3,4,5-tetrahydropyridine-2,6-dicarboxylate N-succinyltransferase [Actinomycetota bacterium]MCL6095258.1 2,3,4,5-tetrahydropyridine-2,6-dicarboxylate N-succinyltransferase [Actinomycetota bacterium]
MGVEVVVTTVKKHVEDLWEEIDLLSSGDPSALSVVTEAIELLDSGEARVAEMDASGEVLVHEWLKKAILLYFHLSKIYTIEVGPFEYADRIPLKRGLADRGVRVVPGACVRWGAHIGRGSVLMPSFVNIGATVGENTMVDTWATVGSCAQVGSRVHLSGGVGIGGVLEPPQAAPVIVGDDAFIGSRCMVTEGAVIGEGAILGAGAILNPSIPVIDAESGQELSRGKLPPWTVGVPAQRRRVYEGGEFFMPCVLVIKHLNPGERHDKAQLNHLLREHGLSL